MNGYARDGAKYILASGVFALLLMSQGCVATRDWVMEQMQPLSARVSQSEGRLTQAEGQISSLGGRMSGVEGRLGEFEGRLGTIDAKAERALTSIANLRLERRFVIDLKEGANFGFNSSSLPSQARKEIDGFLSDLKGDPAAGDGTVYLIAGHTDNVGAEEYNYELGQKRANAVARYLITEKKLDPLRVISVSYGESAPLLENNTSQGRAKNRRVEILVYREGITSTPAAAAAPQAAPQASPQTSEQRFSQKQ